jgi:DNA repair exonuclease SbcCD ATPase subunit
MAGFLGKLKDALSTKEEEIEVDWRNSPERFRKRKEKKLGESRERAEELVEKTERLLERLDDDLEEVKGYEDAADLNVVEDVAENFYRSRKRLVENVELSNDIEQHYDDLKDFLDEFNDVSRKEGAVMKRVQKSSGDLSGTLQELIDHREEVEEFLRNGYRPMKRVDHLEDLKEETEELEEEIERLEEQLDRLDTEDIEERIEDVERRISEFEESEEWEEKENLEEQLELLEDKKSKREKEVKRTVSKLDRGLKKLIYRIENQGQEFEGDFVTLKSLFNGNFRKIDSPFPELDEATSILESKDILDDRQQEKFEKAVEQLETFESDLEEIEGFEEDIRKVEEKLEDIDLEEKRRELEKEKSSIQSELEEKEEQIDNLRDTLEQKKTEFEDKKREIEEKLDTYLQADVSLEKKVETSEKE